MPGIVNERARAENAQCSIHARHAPLRARRLHGLGYWTIRSARARMDCGTVKPSALAVVELTISSIFVGCSTGRSAGLAPLRDRKSTRLNSSHLGISYAVFCLKKKK